MSCCGNRYFLLCKVRVNKQIKRTTSLYFFSHRLGAMVGATSLHREFGKRIVTPSSFDLGSLIVFQLSTVLGEKEIPVNPAVRFV